jgi:uncharacterized protein (DUF1015 family)
VAIVKAFAALRPKPDLAGQICELPYDVMSSAEARQIAAGRPLSFLRVSKPEIDLPEGTNPYETPVYEKGRENLARLLAQGALRQDKRPCFYLYRQMMGQHAQTGLVAVASCAEYLKGTIKKHELTRVDKENDRVRHIETLNSQTGPVFLAYRAVRELSDLFEKKIAQNPEIDFTATDGVRHSSWVVDDPGDIAFLENAFAAVPALYIADGHHRSAAAARVFQARKGAGQSAYFLAVIFPDSQLQILPYNRVLKDLNGNSNDDLLQKLDAVFVIRDEQVATPSKRHELSLYLGGKWRRLTFRPQFAATKDPIEKLDVTLLQKYVLAPIFGIDDPRTSERINFVGGIRGIGELEKLVNSGAYGCAFSMFPTSMGELMAIADAGGIMPPKSTWFEPKLRDAMFCHMI